MAGGSLQARALGANLRSPESHGFALAVLTRAFRMHRGNAVRAAEVLHVSHRVLLDWVSAYPDVEAALRASRIRVRSR